MSRLQDLRGHVFGRLTVVERAQGNDKHTYWRCHCECGREAVVHAYYLTHGRTTSCGCYSRELSRTHGLSGTPVYKVWSAMIERCTNPNNPGYANYGGRGITVCEEWLTFERFFEAMGPRPSPRHSIERRNNSAGYSAGNCYWATPDQQNRNKRNNHYVEYRGNRYTVTDLADVLGVPYDRLRTRLRRGWSIEDATTVPYSKGKHPGL